jgi:hypothetical protein
LVEAVAGALITPPPNLREKVEIVPHKGERLALI